MIHLADQAYANRPRYAIRHRPAEALSVRRLAYMNRLLSGLTVAIVLAVVMTQRSADAATITVQSLSGGSDATQCTLRDAIRAANLDQPVGTCSAGNRDDTIVLAITGTLVLTQTLPVITTTLSIVGPGPASLGLWRDPAGPRFRFFDITTTASMTPSVVISGLRMVNGAAGSGNGGAIQTRNFARLTVVNVAFEGNTAANGGAIHIRGPLTIAHSVFTNNVASNAGGAIFSDLDSVITASTFISNAALGAGSPSLGGGGAVRLNIGPNQVVNSVFVRNWIPQHAPGGAVFRISSLNDTYIFHCTIVGEDSVTPNSAIYTTSGGGIYSTQVRNTIITSHTIALHRGGTISMTEDYNLFYGNIANTLGGSFGPVASGGNSITAAPRFLDAGQNNFRLLGDSPAINAANDIGIRVDMDGFTRPLGLQPDIGAFEHSVDLKLRKMIVPGMQRPGANVSFTLSFSNAGAHGASGVVIGDVLPPGLINITTGATLPITATPGPIYQFYLSDPLIPGAAGIITLSGILSPDLPPGPVTNTATIGSQNWEINTLDNTGTAVVMVSDGERISKWARPLQQILLPGQRITYTMVVSAPEASAMGYLTLTDSIPDNTRLVTDSLAGTGAVAVGTAIVMTQSNIAAGETAMLTFAVEINPVLASSAIVTNVAGLQSEAVAQMSSNVVTHEVRVPASIALAISAATLPADNISSAQVTVTVADAQARPVPGLAIVGQIVPGGRGGLSVFDPTNAAGETFATWHAGPRAGPAAITVSAGLLTASMQITLTPGAPYTVSASASPDLILANGISTSQITLTVVDPFGNAKPSEPVTLSTSLGQLQDIAGTTDLDGRFTTVLTSSVSAGLATVSGQTNNGRAGAAVLRFEPVTVKAFLPISYR